MATNQHGQQKVYKLSRDADSLMRKMRRSLGAVCAARSSLAITYTSASFDKSSVLVEASRKQPASVSAAMLVLLSF